MAADNANRLQRRAIHGRLYVLDGLALRPGSGSFVPFCATAGAPRLLARRGWSSRQVGRVPRSLSTSPLSARSRHGLDEEDQSQHHEGRPGDALCRFTDALAEPGAECQSDLRCDESLHREQRDRPGDWQVEESDAEPDRELVEANGDAERKQRRPTNRGELRDRVRLVVVAENQVSADGDECDACDVLRACAERSPERRLWPVR